MYGTTGAGKTYTMLGSKDNPGITYLTMKELYDQISNLESPADCSLGVCYLEVSSVMCVNRLKLFSFISLIHQCLI